MRRRIYSLERSDTTMFDRSDNEGSYGTSLLIFLLGAAVGATAAILYAPMSGQETRSQIAEKAGELKDKAVDLKDQVAEKAVQWKDAATTKLQGMAEHTGDTMQAAKDGMSNVAQTAKNEATNVGNTARG
jgi:gas vesicle protein